ncbi:hypothetical protein V8D89_002796 [Ganoderma adspersum]
MDHDYSFHPYTHCPPTPSSETLQGAEQISTHGLDFGNVVCTSLLEPDSSPVINMGPFVVMPTSHYIGLQRRLHQLEGISPPSGGPPSGPGIGPVPAEPMSWIAAPAVNAVPEVQASAYALIPTEMGASGKQRKRTNGRRLKVACTFCSDAHKKCDEGRPLCGRCKSSGVSVNGFEAFDIYGF